MVHRDEFTEDSHRPPRRHLGWRIGLIVFLVLFVGCLLVPVFWYDYFRVYVFLLPLVFEYVWNVYLGLPLTVFGSIAAIIFALGCCLCWPPVIARIRPAYRGLLVLAFAFALHSVWFDHAWVPFRPLCLLGGAMYTPNRHIALAGPLTPEAASAFAEELKASWGEDAARLSGSDRVEVRPAIALFDNGFNWNLTTKLAQWLADEQNLEPFERDSLDRCQEVERIVIADGRAEAQLENWGTWPWRTIDDHSRFVHSLRHAYWER